MALILKRLLGCRFLFDLRGLLAEEYVDAGHWREGDIKFRLTKRMERVFFRRADAFVMLTHRIKGELVKHEPSLHLRADDIQVIPCCVDIERFSADPQQRINYRQNRGWTERLVLTYVGKLGTWYLPDEMVKFFAAARQQDVRFFFQVLTQSDPTLIEASFKAAEIPSESYDIRFAPPRELPLILAGSDAGISFIRSCYSKRASSPTKIGEYLAAGLPIVVNAGIGDCDEILRTNRLGVVINDFSDAEYGRVAEELCRLLEANDTFVRCQEYAEEDLGLTKVGAKRYAAVYERFLTLRSQTNARETMAALGLD
jgi:glycosyltransferase involved in cell wall biosynthesis